MNMIEKTMSFYSDIDIDIITDTFIFVMIYDYYRGYHPYDPT
jgi:hypothetical protein